MYNSSIKGQGQTMSFAEKMEIPSKIYFNDMSKNYMNNDFKECDVIYSEISWIYGYKGFNEKADNSASNYNNYINNINRLIEEMNVPSFIICGKNVKKSFPKAMMYPITINTSNTGMNGCQLYVWNYDFHCYNFDNTSQLLKHLADRFNKCLDFSCGYGEHLLQFKDFIACDINRDCLTYLTILYNEKMKGK